MCTLLTVVLLLAGCEDPFIDPFVSGKHFTVYGYLNAFDVDHFVRVVPVRRTPEQIDNPNVPQAEIDAVVTSTDLSTNTEIRWTHTLQQFDDGTYGHVFSSRFVVHPGRRYRLTVRRSDGAESTAETTVPNLPEPEVDPATVTADSVSQVLHWIGAGTPQSIEVVYCAKPIGQISCSGIPINYGRAGHRTSDGWDVPVKLSRDLPFVRQRLAYPDTVILVLADVEMRFTSLDRYWVVPPEPIDPELFAQPAALNNVENGFGYWGSVARTNHSWIPDRRALESLGYVPPA